MKRQLGIQLYSVRSHFSAGQDIRGSLLRLREMGYTQIQTYGALPIPASEYARFVREAGMQVIGLHLPFSEFEHIDQIAALCRTLGTTNAGVGSMPAWLGSDKASTLRFIEQANAAGAALRPYGIKFTYHHHAFEFARAGEKRIMDYLVDGLDSETVSFVLDTYWLQHAGVNILEWIDRLRGRVDILHLKDKGVKPGTNEAGIVELGEGNIDFTSVLEAADQAGITCLCYEQDVCAGDSFDSAARSAENFFARYA